jgi:hypothetical protein
MGYYLDIVSQHVVVVYVARRGVERTFLARSRFRLECGRCTHSVVLGRRGIAVLVSGRARCTAQTLWARGQCAEPERAGIEGPCTTHLGKNSISTIETEHMHCTTLHLLEFVASNG